MEKSKSQIDVSNRLLYNPRRDRSMRSVLEALQEVRAELSCGVDANKFSVLDHRRHELARGCNPDWQPRKPILGGVEHSRLARITSREFPSHQERAEEK